MKSTGVVRKTDELGRITIPKEVRKTLGINDGETTIEIFVEKDAIVLKVFHVKCVMCENTEELRTVQGVKICPTCSNKVAALVKG